MFARVEAKSASKSRDPKLNLMVDRVAPLSFNFDSAAGGHSPGGFLSVHVPPLKVPRTPVSTFHSGGEDSH